MDHGGDINDLDAARRVDTLAGYGILDTAAEPAFDDIVLLASRLCETPVALVSLVTDERQWFKARVGLPASETPLSQSVCLHALLQDETLIIGDLTRDERTRDNTLVTDAPYIRFYAGAVLKSSHGVPLGTLCVIDTVARPPGLTQVQREGLEALARQVVAQLELRALVRQRDAAIAAAEQSAEAFRRQQLLLNAELHHRLKNLLAVVQAVILQTLRHSRDFDEARAAATSRIAALGRAQELLFSREMQSTSLTAIILGTADLYQGSEARFRIEGPELEVGARAALSFALVFHELATNAVKYGALSTQSGMIEVVWTVAGPSAHPGPDEVLITWRELGGPIVVQPTHKGFGTRLVERALAGGASEMLYEPSGLKCSVRVPLAMLRES